MVLHYWLELSSFKHCFSAKFLIDECWVFAGREGKSGFFSCIKHLLRDINLEVDGVIGFVGSTFPFWLLPESRRDLLLHNKDSNFSFDTVNQYINQISDYSLQIFNDGSQDPGFQEKQDLEYMLRTLGFSKASTLLIECLCSWQK